MHQCRYHMVTDIHIDSFPFGGSTSMLESMMFGSVGLAFCPWTNPYRYVGCIEPGDYGQQFDIPKSITQSDIVARTGPILACRTIQAFQTVLNYLITNPKGLESYQNYSQSAIGLHTGVEWANAMELAFDKILQLPKRNRASTFA